MLYGVLSSMGKCVLYSYTYYINTSSCTICDVCRYVIQRLDGYDDGDATKFSYSEECATLYAGTQCVGHSIAKDGFVFT